MVSKNSGTKAKINVVTKGKDNKSTVPSVEKALEIIEYLSESKEGSTMKELIQGLNRTMGELYRIVVYLTEKKYLSLNIDTARYSLTLKLFELSHRHDPVKQLVSHAVPLMQRFSAMTEQSCHLGVLSADNILVLASEASSRRAGYSVRNGAVFHVTDTSSARVIVAHSNDEIKNEYLNHYPEAQRNEIQEQLKETAEQHYEVGESPIVSGVLTLSVPIFNIRGVCAALTCGYIDQTPKALNSEETLEVLRNISIEISRSLGAHGGNVNLPNLAN